MISTDAVTIQFVLDQKNIPLPVKLPYGILPSADVLAPAAEGTPQ